MKVLYKIICATLSLILSAAIALPAKAMEYKTHRSMVLTVIPMKHELALKVIPVVRTFISESGHIAHVKGTDQLVVAAKPETIRILRENFDILTSTNFDPRELRAKIINELKLNHASLLESQIIELNNLEPTIIIRALRSLVSAEGALTLMPNGRQIKVRDYPVYMRDIVKLIKKLDS